MYRSAIEYLYDWRTRRSRKPLVIRGARQVGKSYLIREFAKKSFDNIIEINLDDDSSVLPYFERSDPHEIIKLLEVHFKTSFIPGKTLLFLDEIQAAPHLFAKLRYFYEKMPELHVIAAGSLLEFILEEHNFSMPVGRIEYMYLGPMMFSEFLIAVGHEKLAQYLTEYEMGDEFLLPLHDKLSELVKSYMVIGGMPESVREYVDSGSYRDCGFIKSNILATYKDDFGKYSKKVKQQHILTVFNALPNIVGTKVKYVNISRNERAKDLSYAIHLLSLARVCHLVYHSSCNGIPLGAEINRKVFKPVFLDVGLLLEACGLTMKEIVESSDIMLINSGQISEQFVGQHLLYSQELYKEPQLYYWLRENPASNAEIDYVITHGGKVIPIEVKAGKTGSLRSLHQFTIEKNVDLAVRICGAPPSVVDCHGTMPNGTPYSSQIMTLPFYLIENIDRLLRNREYETK